MLLLQAVPSGHELQELLAANQLDQDAYDFGVLMSRLDAVVWTIAAGQGRVPLQGLPPIIGLDGKPLRGRVKRCGYVPPALVRPHPPGRLNATSPVRAGTTLTLTAAAKRQGPQA